SHQEALTAEAEYLTKRLQLEQEAALAEETLYAENPYSNPQKLNEMYDKASVITAQGMKKITEIQEQQLSQWQEIAMAMGKALSSQVGTQLTKLIEGTTNLRNAFRQTFLAIADAGVKAFAEIMAKELEHFIMSKVLTKEKKAEEVSSNAGAAAAAAFKSAADIPYVGWIIAPAAAAAAYAGAMAYAEDGYDIPAGVNPITQLHQREMVLPAKQADVIRNMADQGGGAGGGNYTINIHAVDAPSVKKLFTDNSSALVAALKSNSRLGGVPSS
ncbi:MAG: hypothetical protein JO253_00580, partial [Alphaproteobacteria bacterium]|nr:hypothetical protein [Alphaproteobacteria bacterium]